MDIKTVGSICSGIEAASVAWAPMGLSFQWFSEIADFQSRVLAEKYPEIKNLGDMKTLSSLLAEKKIEAPDLLCAGTPCQAFSLAGNQNGLEDDRGNLTLNFVDIVNANDKVRRKKNQSCCVALWENVEGVLSDKTNAFGCLVSSLAGFGEVISVKKWPNAGVIHGPVRNVAWRVLDAKYFGLPQQRRRLYVLAGGHDFYPEFVLFEKHERELSAFPSGTLAFEKDGHSFEVFREYSDCLYSAYGTKWNGNAAAYNGSLFVVQDKRLRRISPLECERLMGFPDNYTGLKASSRTNRYQAIGNSWAVPVIRWIGERLLDYGNNEFRIDINFFPVAVRTTVFDKDVFYIDCGKDIVQLSDSSLINCTAIPENCAFNEMRSIVSADAPEEIYISPVGCYGIIRRKNERKININPRLEEVLLQISSSMSAEEIEKRSRVQKRGRFSKD